MFQISFIRIEGVQEPLELVLESQGKKYFGSLSDTRFPIAKSTQLKINILKPSTKSLLCSSSFSTDLLPSDSFQWIPLSFSSADLFKKLPSEVASPRILAFIGYDLSPVKEISETESDEIEKTEILKEPETGKEREGEDYKKMYLKAVRDLEFFKRKYEEEANNNSVLRQQVKKIIHEFEESKNSARLREEFLENLINEKVAVKKAVTDETAHSSMLEDRETDTPRVSSSREGKREEKKRVLSESSLRETPRMTYLALQSYMKKNGIVGKFVQESNNVYFFRGKRVFITMKNGNLMCRSGRVFEGIDEFVKKMPTTVVHKRSKTDGSGHLKMQAKFI